MLLPTFFESVEKEYEHLKNHVQLWDVTVQRQIEVSGKDSYKLIQLMTCRDLSKAKINKCYYVPLIDKEGNMVNDPLILKIDENNKHNDLKIVKKLNRNKLERKLDVYNHTMELVRTIVPIAVLALQIYILVKLI